MQGSTAHITIQGPETARFYCHPMCGCDWLDPIIAGQHYPGWIDCTDMGNSEFERVIRGMANIKSKRVGNG